MPSILDQLEGAGNDNVQELKAIRLKEEPAMILVFTHEYEEASLHYEKDESIRSFIQCPGELCPICYIGSPATKYFLLPVYSIESSSVEVLRIANNRGPGSLLAQLHPFLKDSEIADKVLMISRIGVRYKIRCHKLGEKADRGEIEIQAFLKQIEGGLKLRDAFPLYSTADLAEVDRIRKKLNAMGGYDLPGAASIEADTGESDEEE